LIHFYKRLKCSAIRCKATILSESEIGAETNAG